MAEPSTACRRRIRRHAIPATAEARITFAHPGPAAPRRDYRLIDISVAGLSFAVDTEAPSLEDGAEVSRVVVRVANCEITGDLLIMHVTAEPERTVCGALFYPAAEAELVKLKSLMAGIEAMQPHT